MLRENSSSGSNSSSSQNYLSQDSKLNQDSRDSSSCNGFPQKIFSDSNRGARLTNECTDKFNLFEAILVSILQFFCFSYANMLHASFLPYNRLLHFSFLFLRFSARPVLLFLPRSIISVEKQQFSSVTYFYFYCSIFFFL